MSSIDTSTVAITKKPLYCIECGSKYVPHTELNHMCTPCTYAKKEDEAEKAATRERPLPLKRINKKERRAILSKSSTVQSEPLFVSEKEIIALEVIRRAHGARKYRDWALLYLADVRCIRMFRRTFYICILRMLGDHEWAVAHFLEPEEKHGIVTVTDKLISRGSLRVRVVNKEVTPV